MICAIYARKSTDQAGIADEQKSIARQIDHARAYAIRKGWTVAEKYIFVDDGISGAEFANRPGFLRLMNSLKPRPSFQVLVMSEESRLGREAIETAYALKQLVQAGVRVWFYLEDRERTLDSPTDKIMLSLTAFADELEREKARQRTYDAMLRKARAGHVTGGRLFGYDQFEILGADGRRSHVDRQINGIEASVIREIFELCASGEGLKAIAKALNERNLPSPRPQRGRRSSWAPSSVREVLHRDTYRGLITWNRTKKRDAWGQKRQTARPTTDWLTVPAETLRIVPEPLWRAAHDRMADRRQKHDQWRRNRRTGEPDGRGVRKRYLLSGFGRCASCGGSMQVVSRPSTRGRTFRYICGTYWNCGASICSIGRMVDMPVADAAIRNILASEILRPKVVNRAVDIVLEHLERQNADSPDQAIRQRLADVEQKLGNLADTAAQGGAVPAILDALSASRPRTATPVVGTCRLPTRPDAARSAPAGRNPNPRPAVPCRLGWPGRFECRAKSAVARYRPDGPHRVPVSGRKGWLRAYGPDCF